MKVRFCTSVADGPFSHVEGTVLTLPSPTPRKFVDLLNAGIVEPVRDGGVPLTPDAVERAVALRRPARGRRRARATADDGP